MSVRTYACFCASKNLKISACYIFQFLLQTVDTEKIAILLGHAFCWRNIWCKYYMSTLKLPNFFQEKKCWALWIDNLALTSNLIFYLFIQSSGVKVNLQSYAVLFIHFAWNIQLREIIFYHSFASAL